MRYIFMEVYPSLEINISCRRENFIIKSGNFFRERVQGDCLNERRNDEVLRTLPFEGVGSLWLSSLWRVSLKNVMKEAG